MIRDAEALAERAENLEAADLNGIRMVRVEIADGADGPEAALTVFFHNALHLQQLADDVAAATDPAVAAAAAFPLSGGERLRAPSVVRVRALDYDAVAEEDAVELTVFPVGDQSTYTLRVVGPAVDPIFSEIDFKFRPACFDQCGVEWEAPAPLRPAPPIDYLARDYDSFRHELIAWMIDRVPGWQPTSEADLDMVVLELFSVAGDELADFQDRVMSEAYLGTARKRVSLARHARLMDYHVHQGSQASTWLAVEVDDPGPLVLAPGFTARTTEAENHAEAVVFLSRDERTLHPLLNEVALYSWDHAIPALEIGTTSADLAMPSQADADTVVDLIQDGLVTHLVVEELLNPRTGRVEGRDPTKRQLLELVADSAEAVEDPIGNRWMVRVGWRAEDALTRRFCFETVCGTARVEGIACFRGNLVPMHHGRPEEVVFREPGTELPLFPAPGDPPELYLERDWDEALCRLPSQFLAYRQTAPGGEEPPLSTLDVRVEIGVDSDAWDEVAWLIQSTDDDELGDHFMVETDELGWSVVRFGNGVQGRSLPAGASVRCTYQVGRGEDGNVGADSLNFFDAVPRVLSVRNPLDVTDGVAPEPVEEIRRRVPEAFRQRQLRAVTLKDYVRRAEEVEGVSRAAAAYGWTGSWRTVRVTVDPAAGVEYDDALVQAVLQHLEAVRLLGEDLEVRPPVYAPLRIDVTVCVHRDYWPRDVRFLLEQEFSTGYAPDGLPAFFHPDRWTFGQALHASEILGRVQRVPGVDHVIKVEMRRLHAANPLPNGEFIPGPSQIVRVDSDPDHAERGTIRFTLQGGRG